MTIQNNQIQKSRLGRLLVIRGFITESQLDQALREQGQSGRMLGEVLLAHGWVSEQQLKTVLKQQRRYRKMATVVAMFAAPIQPMVAFAASPAAIPVSNTRVESVEVHSFGSKRGLQMLDDEAMSAVSAQGFFPGEVSVLAQTSELMMNPQIRDVSAGQHNQYRDQEEDEEKRNEQIAHQLNDTVLTMIGFGPVSQLLDADISVQGVKHQEGRAPMEVLADGRVKFYMPSEIERISMENIRVKGSDDPEIMGSIYMSDIKFYNSSYTIGSKRDWDIPGR
jgi:hypothetical protein